jgi:hypothetical protein
MRERCARYQKGTMKLNWRTTAITLSAALALLSGCGSAFDDTLSDDGGSDQEQADEDADADVGAVVLGATWQALSYPACMFPWSDPDGDGLGFEYGRACVTYKAPSTPGVAGAGSTGGTATSTTKMNCANPEGTASTMAAIAVAAATELKRWQPTKDFAIGKQGSEDILVLTATGKARCSDGKCANTQALLDFQKNEANGNVLFPGNVSLNSGALRSRLVAKFRDQAGCEAQPSNGGTTNCPAEEHLLTFQRSEKGGCDTNYFFVAKKPDGKPLQFPAQLKNKLQFADKLNPYIGFQSVGEVVSIDPTYGLNEAGSTSSGNCMTACVRISLSNAAGQCCSCNGKTKTFSKAGWSSYTYLCR